MNMIITNNRIKEFDNHVEFSAMLDAEKIFIHIPHEYKNYISDTLDSFLLIALIPAMKKGKDLYIDGTVSEKLLYNINNYVIKIFTQMMPELHKINVTAKKLHSENQNIGNATTTGFSAGVDSFSALYDHSENSIYQNFRVSHFIFNNVGAFGHIDEARDKEEFDQKFSYMKDIVDKPLIPIDTNFTQIIDSCFQLTHVIRNVAATLSLQKLFFKYLYASGFRYLVCHTGPTHDMATADPIILPLFSTESIDIISTGMQYARTEKIKLISDFPLTYKHLDVCVSTEPRKILNCSKCYKCLRTIMTLDVIKKLDLYETIFDRKFYDQIKFFYWIEIFSSSDPINQEIVKIPKDKTFFYYLVYCISKLLIFIPEKLKKAFFKRLYKLIWKCFPCKK